VKVTQDVVDPRPKAIDELLKLAIGQSRTLCALNHQTVKC
jgi:hypothetical protein